VNASGSLEFAYARLSARFAERADEAVWRRIEVVRDAGAVLDIVRGSTLAPWVAGVGPDGGARALEAAARRHWRALVDEVAGWMPPPWQGAVRWCAALADLPALAQLSAGHAPAAWLRNDPGLRDLVVPGQGGGDAARAALVRESAGDAHRMLALWQDRWRALLPEPLPAHPLLQRLVQMLEEHVQRFAHAHPADAWPLRRGLAGRVMLVYRRAGVDPAQAFAYLTLTALDGERLRAELVPRALLPQRTLAA
jgi:hypothetical protein